jgi:mannose-6-phosphate isomerase
MKLLTKEVEKPWGRKDLPEQFADFTQGRRIGEIWFEEPSGRQTPLLVKYIFTSEKLSVQVHPNDEQARVRGLPNGKTECWLILGAEPDSSIALGFREPLDRERMREAALDGSLEEAMDWKPVKAGDFFYVPAGTVHAIGAGISLIEIQQQSDVTYRLYDYGRPRELHLDDGIAVARGELYPAELMTNVSEAEDRTLVPGPLFQVEQVVAEGVVARLADRQRFVLPLTGTAETGGERASPGECLLVAPGEPLSASAGARLLLASPA